MNTNKNQYILFYVIVSIICFILIITNSPYKNYTPVIWGIFGFGLYAFMTGRIWTELCSNLISKYSAELRKNEISFYLNGMRQTIDFFQFWRKSESLKRISPEIQSEIILFKTFVKLTVLAFLLIILFAFLIMYNFIFQ